MPGCQISRLSSLVDKVSPGHDTALWIDTLCVPVHSKRHRKLSISRLRTTYKQAAKVLILDRQMLQVMNLMLEPFFFFISRRHCHIAPL